MRTQGACTKTGSTTSADAQKGRLKRPRANGWTGSAKTWLRINPLNNDPTPPKSEERTETLEDLRLVEGFCEVADVIGRWIQR